MRPRDGWRDGQAALGHGGRGRRRRRGIGGYMIGKLNCATRRKRNMTKRRTRKRRRGNSGRESAVFGVRVCNGDVGQQVPWFR